MRKHYDYVYKRKQLTSRQGDSVATGSLESNRQLDSDLHSAAAATARQAVRTSFDQRLAPTRVGLSRAAHGQRSEEGADSEAQATRRLTRSTCPPSRASNHIASIPEAERPATSGLKSDEREVRSRCSSSNTDGLFRKRSKSRQSRADGESSPLLDVNETETPRTDIANVMTGHNIHNMILLEHMPPLLDEDTPTRHAKRSLLCETSLGSSVKKDPTICRLAQKLRGLKEKENSVASPAHHD